MASHHRPSVTTVGLCAFASLICAYPGKLKIQGDLYGIWHEFQRAQFGGTKLDVVSFSLHSYYKEAILSQGHNMYLNK